MALEDEQDGRELTLAWPELAAETPLAESRLARWRRICADAGYEV